MSEEMRKLANEEMKFPDEEVELSKEELVEEAKSIMEEVNGDQKVVDRPLPVNLRKNIDKRISKIKKKIIDYANYADENISDNIIDEFTNKIIVYNDHLDWYLACLDELKETNGPLNSFHEVLFVEVTITEDEVENFKQNNPEYVKIRLSEPLKINVYI